MLNFEQTIYYVRRAKEGDEKAKSVLFENNSPLLKSIVNRFKNKGIEYEDLYQIACIGFIKALNNFDESFGVKFSTYIVPMVIGEIKRYMRDNGAIKVSRSIKILANKMNRYIDFYQTQTNEQPTIEHLAEKFCLSKDEVVIALDSSRKPLSIYERVEGDEEGQELIDKIPYSDDEDKRLDLIHLSSVIDSLSDREQKLVSLRFFRDRTQSEVARFLGVSQVQVSRLENKILDKIRLKF